MSNSEEDVPPRSGLEPSERPAQLDGDRLAADAQLVQLVRDELKDPGRPHRAYDLLAETLVNYAVPVLHAWLANGQLSTRIRQLGVGTPPLLASEHAALRNDPAAAQDLVLDAVGRALSKFSDRTLKSDEGGWNPDAGTSLKTYFLNTSLLEMANVTRSWRRTRQRPAEHGFGVGLLRDDVELLAPSNLPGPLEVVLEKESQHELFVALSRIDSLLTYAVLERTETGRSWSQIAQELGISSRALEGRLRRLRDRLERDRDFMGSGSGSE